MINKLLSVVGRISQTAKYYYGWARWELTGGRRRLRELEAEWARQDAACQAEQAEFDEKWAALDAARQAEFDAECDRDDAAAMQADIEMWSVEAEQADKWERQDAAWRAEQETWSDAAREYDHQELRDELSRWKRELGSLVSERRSMLAGDWYNSDSLTEIDRKIDDLTARIERRLATI